jgi:predicted phosphodiesterase
VRYALLADIHGNLTALQAVLAEVRRRGVEGYLVAGDLVGYGPEPNACVELVAGLDAVCVAGNHDLIALGRLSDERCIELARASLRWTRGVLRDDARAYLAGLELTAEAPGGVVVAHGSLDDPQCYVDSAVAGMGQLRQLAAERPGALALVLGHTHVPLACTLAGRHRPRRGFGLPGGRPALLNPGAVGQSRDRQARARFAILDLERGSVTFDAIPYDVEACRAALRSAGLGPSSCHLRPSLARAFARQLRRSADYLRAAREAHRAGT